MHLKAGLVLPHSWKASPDVASLDVPAGSDAKTGFSITIPDSWDPNKARVAVAADIVADEHYLGQIAEGVVDIEFT